jgi:hypothetical protein
MADETQDPFHALRSCRKIEENQPDGMEQGQYKNSMKIEENQADGIEPFQTYSRDI